MEDQSLQQVLQKYIEGKATPREAQWLLAHFHTDSEDELMQLIMKEFAIDQHDVQPHHTDQQVLDRVYSRLQGDLQFSGVNYRQKPVRKMWRFVAAASVVLILSFSGFFLLHQQQQQTSWFKNDIRPGHDQATLTLANGKKIILTKGLSGTLAQLGNTLVNAHGVNGISYTAGASTSPVVEAVTYNTLTTARGEQSPYPLILADGTKVWLNAASSITFPTRFQGSERRVKVTGEAYFEVVHNAAKPFFVNVKDESVEDIGTHFDVFAYDDEPVTKTTLLEGSVKITSNKQTALLKPGQQSIVKNGNSAIQVADADLKQAIAWKNGKFMFRSESVEAVMRQVSRWYNVNITYKDNIADKEIWGTVDRYGNVSEVLDMIELTGVAHFQVTGRNITVTK